MNVLLLEDDRSAAAHIELGLSKLGHLVHLSQDGRDAYADFCDREFDVAIIDRMVPGLDGLSLVRRLRAEGFSTPVLMLTALSLVEDRVEVSKVVPTIISASPSPNLSRMNALARRPQKAAIITHLRAQDIEMNLLRREVTRGGRGIDLQPREFRLLEQLLRHSDRILIKPMLLETV